MFNWFQIIFLFLTMSAFYIANLMAQERDPFISMLDLEKQKQKVQIAKKIDVSEFVLKGILWNERQAVAIINDELVMADDAWKGLKITRIDRDSVIVSDGADSYKLSIAEDIVPTGKGALKAKSQEPPPEANVAPLPLTAPGEWQGGLPGDTMGMNPNEP